MTVLRRLALLAGGLTSLALTSPARADDNDLSLARLGTIDVTANDVIPDEEAFRSLASELGVVIAPKPMSPSDTTGYSGFQFATELHLNTVSGAETWWRGAQGAGPDDDNPAFSTTIPTLGLFVRKGMWLPVPSFEVSAGALKLFDSNMWAMQVSGKFALHEGYHGWPLPSLAVRGAASRLMGTDQVDLTVASVDVSASKRFGIQGTWALEPYGGGNMLWIIPRSEVIDATPEVDATVTPGDIRMNFVFPDQDDIRRIRFFFGMKFRYYLFSLTAEVAHTLAGASSDVRVAGGNRQETDDKAGSQQTYSVGISMDL